MFGIDQAVIGQAAKKAAIHGIAAYEFFKWFHEPAALSLLIQVDDFAVAIIEE